MAEREGELALLDVLVRPPDHVGPGGRVGVELHFGGRKRAGILRLRGIGVAEPECGQGVPRGGVVQPQVERGEAGLAVLAESVHGRVGEREGAAHGAPAPGGAPLHLEEAERPAFGAHRLGEGSGRGRLGNERQDAARRIAVQGRARAPEYLDPLEVRELHVGELALAVRQRLRDPVEENLDAPGAEVGPTPVPADREPLVEREVVAVGDVDAWHVVERLVQSQRRLAQTELPYAHDAHRGGHLGQGLRGAGHRDHDLGKLDRRVGPDGVAGRGDLRRQGDGERGEGEPGNQGGHTQAKGHG